MKSAVNILQSLVCFECVFRSHNLNKWDLSDDLSYIINYSANNNVPDEVTSLQITKAWLHYPACVLTIKECRGLVNESYVTGLVLCTYVHEAFPKTK